MRAFSFQRIGEYKESDQAKTVAHRDYKDATDLVAKIGGWGDEMAEKTVVRRLTERECERLQGFPDNWTLIGEPEETEVKDYEYTYDADGNVVSKKQVGSHKEIEHYWTDESGKRRKVTASSRYKALGNSIATPYWRYLARRIVAQYEHDVTMGSLFDGIGGFPYVFEQCGAKAVWASEVEPFCIAVTKEHFPE